MNRLAPHLVTLAALLAGGCIENPGVDPGLGQSGAAEKVSIDARFRQGNFLQLRLTQDSGRIALTAANTGLGSIDSAAFLLWITCTDRGLSSPPPPEHGPNLEFYGRVAGLQQGASADLGIIDTLLAHKLSECAKQAWVIRASEDGRRTGSAFGGVFTGRHRAVDTGGKVYEGPLRGLITADGAFRFSVYQADNDWPLGELVGSVSDSGTMASSFQLGYHSPGKEGRLFPSEGGFGGSFTFANVKTGMSRGMIDSLALDYQPFSPR